MMKMIKTTSMAKRVMKKLTKMRMARGIRKKVRGGGGGGGEVRRDSWWCMVTIVNIAEDDYFNVDDFFKHILYVYILCEKMSYVNYLDT